jgi:hypothetical protein
VGFPDTGSPIAGPDVLVRNRVFCAEQLSDSEPISGVGVRSKTSDWLLKPHRSITQFFRPAQGQFTAR